MDEKRAKDLQLFEDVAECLGMAILETLRCAVFNGVYGHSHSAFAIRAKDTGNLREAWRNLARKVYDYAEPE